MAVSRQCPSCGLESQEIRCPRCNALKVVGCSGDCALCRAGCRAEVPLTVVRRRPSDAAFEDAEHTGTPLER
jgi:hypothetical protein